ncbi:MAG: dGTP triphosphohydrolase [Bacteroidota bacterium]
MMEWNRLMSPLRAGETYRSQDDEIRTRFDQDYDRIIFSHPFRKLQDKTQVFPLPEHDFVHTRLTHSLEVSSVGRSLGKEVGKVLIDRHGLSLSTHHFGGVVAAASLAHDLGNPPFGHSGEDGISAYFTTASGLKMQTEVAGEAWVELNRFEGNAQGFRILNHERYGGLRLTYATLAAFTKYPKTASSPSDKGRRSQKKYGICTSDLGLYKALAQEMEIPEVRRDVYLRHPLSFLVEAADDICYHIIDLEDGCRLGLVTLDETIELLSAIIGERFSLEKFQKISSKEEKLGLLRALSIQQLITESVACFLDHERDILSGDFDRSMTDEMPSTPVLNQIIDLSIKKIYRARQVVEREAAGFEIIEKLMQAFCESMHHQHMEKVVKKPRLRAIYRLLPEDYQQLLEREQSLYSRLQLIVDFVSGLTDKSAVNLYKTISGFTLPG